MVWKVQCTHPRCRLNREHLPWLERAKAALCEVSLLHEAAEFLVVLGIMRMVIADVLSMWDPELYWDTMTAMV